jgi:hypothetical protein
MLARYGKLTGMSSLSILDCQSQQRLIYEAFSTAPE